MQLYIDKKPAIIKKGTSIKLTRENPAITQSGDYTLDVTLPLSGCKENLDIFGPANYRAASPKSFAGKRYDFYLNAGEIQLSGTAIVTQISEEELKLQLLAGNSELNFDNREGGDKYIDELDLGRAYWEEWEADTNTLLASPEPYNMARLIHSFSTLIPNSTRADELMHGTNEHTNCVLFPIYSTADGAFSNKQEIQYFAKKESADSAPIYEYNGYRFSVMKGAKEQLPNSEPFYALPSGLTLGMNSIKIASFAPQPYLCFILERVLAAVGYELKPTDNCMREGWLGKIFVANARNTIEFCECLPHWTVEEFLTQLREAFGVVVYAEGKKCRAVSRSSIYGNSHVKELHSVIDERNVDITEEEDNTGATSGNVSYDFTEVVPSRLNIGTEPYENMEVRRVASAQSVFNAIMDEGGTAEDKAKVANSSILFYEIGSHRRFGCFNTSEDPENPNYVLREVDQLGPLFKNKTYDECTALKIVPAFMAEDIPTLRHRFDKIAIDTSGTKEYKGTFVAPTNEEPTQEEGGDMYGFFIPYLITDDSRESFKRSRFSLQKYLQDGEGITESSDNSTRDIMEVAVNAGQYTCKWNSYPDDFTNNEELTQIVPYPIGTQYIIDRMDAEEVKKIGGIEHFSLHSGIESNMMSNLRGNGIDFDSRIVHQFSFTDHQIDPTALYLINGRRFACQKLELTIDEDGLKPLIKGYFFELQ